MGSATIALDAPVKFGANERLTFACEVPQNRSFEVFSSDTNVWEPCVMLDDPREHMTYEFRLNVKTSKTLHPMFVMKLRLAVTDFVKGYSECVDRVSIEET